MTPAVAFLFETQRRNQTAWHGICIVMGLSWLYVAWYFSDL